LSIARMAAELADETTRLTGFTASEGLSVRAVFDVSYRHLDAGAAALYRRLALHPGADFGAGIVAALTATLGVPGPPPIEVLLQASLIQERDEDRFRYHDLLRLHAASKADTDETGDDRRATVLVMAEWYLAAAQRADDVVTPYRRRPPYTAWSTATALPQFGGRGDALRWLELERENLTAAGRTALELGHAELAWHLCDVLWPLLLFCKPPLPERRELDRRGVAAARAWGDAWAEGVMLKRLGWVTAQLGDHAAAEAHTRAAIERYTAADDVRGMLDAQEGLADVHFAAGRVEQGVQILTEVLAGNRRLGAPRSIGLTLIGLGLRLPALGRAAEAVALLHEARAVFEGLAAIDPYNGVRATIGLAGALLAAGDPAAAERAATEAAQRMHGLGAVHEQAEALALLGRIARHRGDRPAARRHYRAAIDLLTGTGSAQVPVLRHTLDELESGGGGGGPPDA